MPAYTPILATLGYIMSPDGASVLMIHRDPPSQRETTLGAAWRRG